MKKPIFNISKPDKSLLKDKKEQIYIIESKIDPILLSDIIEQCPKNIPYEEIFVEAVEDYNDYYCGIDIYYYNTIPANPELYNKQLKEYKEKHDLYLIEMKKYNEYLEKKNKQILIEKLEKQLAELKNSI